MASLRKFLSAHRRPESAPVDIAPVTYERAGETLPADLYTPRGTTRRLPGWVILHGLTCTARAHPSLRKFVTSMSASGNVALVPEIPEWRALHVAPSITIETIRAAVRALHDRPEVDPDRIGLLGFSFGATQALVAVSDPAVGGLLKGICAWGGYCDVPRLFRFGLTGEHEIDGVTESIAPDPYGRWIMLGNYLTQVPGHEQDQDIERALHQLALEAGRTGIPAYDPRMGPIKQQQRATLPAAKHELFDLLAPPGDSVTDGGAYAHQLAVELSATALRVDPLLDPRPHLPNVRTPVLIAHGRDDRLIPYSESVRIARTLPGDRVRALAITALFAHSGGAQHGLGAAGYAREGVRFVSLLRRLLTHI